MDNEVAEARARLAAKFGKAQLGGKGTSLKPTSALLTLLVRLVSNFYLPCFLGTQRRAQKKTPHNAQAAVNEDKRLKAAIKKFGK